MVTRTAGLLCATSANGYWTVEGKHAGEFVVFDYCGQRHAFLLTAWRGRPAFTIMPLEGVELAATYHDEVITLIAMGSHFAPSYSSLGLLRLEAGRALISTLDGGGQPIEVELAELASVVQDDGHYWFRWGLMLKSTRLKSEEVVFAANGNACWLNPWRAPFWSAPEGYEDVGCGGLTMVMGPDQIMAEE